MSNTLRHRRLGQSGLTAFEVGHILKFVVQQNRGFGVSYQNKRD